MFSENQPQEEEARNLILLMAAREGAHNIINCVLDNGASDDDQRAIIRGAIMGDRCLNFISSYVNAKEFSEYILNMAAEHGNTKVLDEISKLGLVSGSKLNAAAGKYPQIIDWAVEQPWFNFLSVGMDAAKTGNRDVLNKLIDEDLEVDTLAIRLVAIPNMNELIQWLIADHDACVLQITEEAIRVRNYNLIDWLLETRTQRLSYMMDNAAVTGNLNAVAYLMTRWSATPAQYLLDRLAGSEDMLCLMELLAK